MQLGDDIDLDLLERLAKAAEEREDHPGYTDAPLYALNDYLTPARALELVRVIRGLANEAMRAVDSATIAEIKARSMSGIAKRRICELEYEVERLKASGATDDSPVCEGCGGCR